MFKIKYALLVFFTFVIGFSIGSEELPFDDTIQNFIKKSDKDMTKYETIDPIFYETNVDSIINIKNSNDVKKIRDNLQQFIWKESYFSFERMPSYTDSNFIDERYSNLSNLEKIDKLTTIMEYDVSSTAYLFLPIEKNYKLVIYHAGHEGDFFNAKETIEFFLNNNYAVLTFSMPLYGQNNNPIIEHENFGILKMTSHDYFYFIDSENFSSIKFFVEPILTSINYSLAKYEFDSIHMVGLSGGAWTTTLYAAIDERINKSFPVGGPLPTYLRVDGNLGHYEQINPELYDIANYLELYVLGSFGDNREQIKIVNKYDSCCHYGITFQTFEENLINLMNNLGSGSFRVFLDDTHMEHKISEKALEIILQYMNK